MAGGLSAFMAQNVKKPENLKIAASLRFVEDEKPILWELRALSSAEDEALRKKYTALAQVTGKPNQFRQEFDANGYMTALAALATVYPNLNDKELQDSYGVMGAQALLGAMLTAGEIQRYLQCAQEVCGFNLPAEQVETAKN